MNIHWNLCIVSVLNEDSGNRFVPSSNKEMKTQQQHKEPLLLKSLLSLLEHGVRSVRTYVEVEMAWQATLRPEMDWSMDAELPQRLKVWKRQVTSELRLQMAADPKKQQQWACTYVIVCAGEQGENVIQQAKLLEETEDHTKILGALDEFVSPSTHFVEDSFNYFYLKQGEMSVSHYQAAAEQLIEKIQRLENEKHTDVKQLLLRNLLLVGLRYKDVLKQCQTMKSDACTAEHLLNLARQAEYRDTTALRLTKTVASNGTHCKTLNHRSIRSTREDRR